MIDSSTIMVAIGGLTCLLSVGTLVFKSGWGLSGGLGKMEGRLAQKIAEAVLNLETQQRESATTVGDSLSALRQQMTRLERDSLGEAHKLSDQIRQVEIWARDEFVRKESFRDVCTRIEASVAEHARDVNNAVQSVRDAIMGLATGNRAGG